MFRANTGRMVKMFWRETMNQYAQMGGSSDEAQASDQSPRQMGQDAGRTGAQQGMSARPAQRQQEQSAPLTQFKDWASI
jgi:hypothetical protein